MEFKKLSKLQKWYLKYTNKAAYKKYKQQLHERGQEEQFYQRSTALRHPSMAHPYKAVTAFKHSGNAGDIIYSLPTVWELSKNGKAAIYLHTDQPIDNKTLNHPLGNVMLNDRIVQMLQPLLAYQPQVAIVEKFADQPVDYNLDEFRHYSMLLDRGSIVRWYFHVYGISYDSSQPWLTAPKEEQYADKLVIARSSRYRSPAVDYGFLKNYPHKLFVGLREEYEEMKTVLPELTYKPVNDFLELATIINSCKLFIGNQSFPFSLAEALKANRLLEVYYKSPNVIPEGRGANDFMYQPQFEYAVKRLLEE